MSVCLYVCMSACLHVSTSVCPYVCISVCLYACMSSWYISPHRATSRQISPFSHLVHNPSNHPYHHFLPNIISNITIRVNKKSGVSIALPAPVTASISSVSIGIVIITCRVVRCLVRPYVRLSVCLYVRMSACLYVPMSVCLYVGMSLCLHVILIHLAISCPKKNRGCIRNQSENLSNSYWPKTV